MLQSLSWWKVLSNEFLARSFKANYTALPEEHPSSLKPLTWDSINMLENLEFSLENRSTIYSWDRLSHILRTPILFVFRAAPAVYGSSQARGQMELQLPTYTTATVALYPICICDLYHAHGNARSLTDWARSGVEPATSGFLVRFVSTARQQEFWFIQQYSCLSI